MPDQFVRTAIAADAERCLATLTLAFSGDPPCRWAWPDPQQYLEAFPRFARAFGGWAIEHGTAHYYEGFSGVALWLPPGAAPDEESLVKMIEDTVTDERKGAMFSMFEQMDALHPLGSGANFLKCMFLSGEKALQIFRRPGPRPKARERLLVFRLVV